LDSGISGETITDRTETVRLSPEAPTGGVDLRTPAELTGATVLLHGTVEGGDGAPTPLVRWGSILEVPPSFDEAGWAEFLAAEDTAVETHASGGDYAFSEAPPGARTSTAAVAFHPRALAAAVRVSEAVEAPPIHLSPVPTFVAKVSDEGGAAAEGATVTHLGAIPLPAPDISALLHHGEYTSTASGRVEILPTPGESLLQASRGDRRSVVWRGRLNGEDEAPTLVLHDTFPVTGKVLGAGPNLPLEKCEVLVRGPGEAWDSMLTCHPVQASGSFAFEVPWIGPGEYLFRLHSPALQPIELPRQVADSGEDVHVDFTCRGGYPRLLQIVDEHGEGIGGVRLFVIWDQQGRWVRNGAHTDPEGMATVEHCPNGEFWVRTYARGYVDEAHGPFEMIGAWPKRKVIPLRSTGTIRGKVTQDGEPLDTFEVLFWGDNSSSRVTSHFENVDDGAFELADAPLGRVHLVAFTDKLPAGPIEAVDVTPGDPPSVDLTVNAPILCQGRVIDIADGSGLAGVRLEPWTMSYGSTLEPWGETQVTDADGRFEDLPLSRHSAGLVAQTEGYEKRTFNWSDLEGRTCDLGLLGLARSQDLTVQLVSDHPIDFTRFRVRTTTGSLPEPTRADPSGIMTVTGVRGGYCGISVFTPEGGRIDLDTRLVPGEEWHVRVPVRTSRRVHVVLEGANGAAPPEGLWVNARYTPPGGFDPVSQLIRVEASGTATLENVLGDDLALMVVDIKATPIAARSVHLDGGAVEQTVTVRLGHHPATLRLLNGDGIALADVGVVVRVVGDPTGCEFFMHTDGEGLLDLPDWGAGQAEICLDTLTGLSAPRVVDLRDTSGGNPIEVRFASDHALLVRFLEEGSPVLGLRSVLRPKGVVTAENESNSDGAGLTRFKDLTPGVYELTVEGQGWWPLHEELTASPDPPIVDLVVRRLGHAELRITREGLPLHGAAISLHSIELDQGVEAWVAEGLVQASPPDLRTGMDGILRFTGLPVGPYEWRLDLAGLEEPIQGSLEVEAFATTATTILVPQ